jgi:hypothetical protein
MLEEGQEQKQVRKSLRERNKKNRRTSGVVMMNVVVVAGRHGSMTLSRQHDVCVSDSRITNADTGTRI